MRGRKASQPKAGTFPCLHSIARWWAASHCDISECKTMARRFYKNIKSRSSSCHFFHIDVFLRFRRLKHFNTEKSCVVKSSPLQGKACALSMQFFKSPLVLALSHIASRGGGGNVSSGQAAAKCIGPWYGHKVHGAVQ